MAAGAVSLRKSHDIVILSFCNKVKGQANTMPQAMPLVLCPKISKRLKDIEPITKRIS